MTTTTEKKINEIVTLARKKGEDERMLDAVLELLKSDEKSVHLLMELLEHKEYLSAFNKLMSIREAVEEEQKEGSAMSGGQKQELDRRRERHEKGEGRSYTWEEAKASIRGEK